MYTCRKEGSDKEPSKKTLQDLNESQLLAYCGTNSNPPLSSSINLNKQVAGSIKGPYNFVGNNNLMDKNGRPLPNDGGKRRCPPLVVCHHRLQKCP